MLIRWEELAQSETIVSLSPVTVAELWHGALPHEYQTLRALFDALHCVPVDAEIGIRAGAYLRQYRRSHRVELGDALIAATASIHGLQMWTRNRKYYQMKDALFYGRTSAESTYGVYFRLADSFRVAGRLSAL